MIYIHISVYTVYTIVNTTRQAKIKPQQLFREAAQQVPTDMKIKYKNIKLNIKA